MSLADAIAERQSVRDFSAKPLAQQQLSQLLWAAQGITKGLRRATPSAGAIYPLKVFVVCGAVDGIDAGLYHYNIQHTITLLQEGDFRSKLAQAALGQMFISEAPVSIIICARYDHNIVLKGYGTRAGTYAHIEVGHVGQNIYLQATALGLGTVAVGAFEDALVHEVLMLDKQLRPFYIMPVGYRKESTHV
jgi:SagB-type dehydrogenase family enzyme